MLEDMEKRKKDSEIEKIKRKAVIEESGGTGETDEDIDVDEV